MANIKVRIDVVSDVVCPWCYIGKARLDKAIEQLKNKIDFEVYYHAFELNPNVPKEGLDQKQYLTQKFGSIDNYHELTKSVSEVASQEGLKFDFEQQKVSPNTFDAHRIIWLAGTEGKQSSVVEALFRSYFEKGIDLSRQENLISVVSEAGLDESKVRKLFQTDGGVKEVREVEEINRKIGISGVPFYIFNEKYSLSGAQPTEIFIKAIQDISSVSPSADSSCDIEGDC